MAAVRAAAPARRLAAAWYRFASKYWVLSWYAGACSLGLNHMRIVRRQGLPYKGVRSVAAKAKAKAEAAAWHAFRLEARAKGEAKARAKAEAKAKAKALGRGGRGRGLVLKKFRAKPWADAVDSSSSCDNV